ncbi:MAG: hypothetical protein ACW98Y_10835 [Candidatus Thorarchaeota archaeon]|jgi:NhaP-type Na+/H+ or K+/H+ antiporter
MANTLENKIIGLIALIIVSMGFVFPGFLIYLNVFHALDIWFVGFITFLSLVAAAGLSAVLMLFTIEPNGTDDQDRKIERFRESQIDLLRDLDEMIPYLHEIERLLKSEE